MQLEDNIFFKQSPVWFKIKIRHKEVYDGVWRWTWDTPPKDICDQLWEKSWSPNIGTVWATTSIKVCKDGKEMWAILIVPEQTH